MTSLLESTEIRAALHELAQRLHGAAVTASIRVVGGAALAIEYFDRPATRDVDCMLSPADDIKAVAAKIGSERGWPADWLNDKVRHERGSGGGDFRQVLPDEEIKPNARRRLEACLQADSRSES
jgi:hypothetical protein